MRSRFRFPDAGEPVDRPAVRVDRRYDRRSRSWVLALKDADDNQVGEAEYHGDKAEADRAEKRLAASLS